MIINYLSTPLIVQSLAERTRSVALVTATSSHIAEGLKNTVADLYRGDGERFSGTVPRRARKVPRANLSIKGNRNLEDRERRSIPL